MERQEEWIRVKRPVAAAGLEMFSFCVRSWARGFLFYCYASKLQCTYFFDPISPLLRNILREMKDQYIRICIKERKKN